MTLQRTLVFAVLPLALLVVAGCGGGSPEAHPERELPAVEAILASAEATEAPETVTLYGSVEADRQAVVSTRVMATVTAVHVQAGDPVRRGRLLLELDPQAVRGQTSQARGALAQAQAALALAERNYRRFEELAQTNAASELELDQARMHYEQAQGAVEQAEGAVSSASSMEEDARITAPFDGRVARRMVEVGDLAAPGRPLLILESESSHRLAVAVPETIAHRARLAIGDEVPVEIDVRPDLGRLEGTVAEMTPGADPRARTFAVEIALPPDRAPGVATGAAGRAHLAVGTREVLAVPADAVLHHGGLALVVVTDSEDRARSRVVTLGDRLAGDRVEILSGLTGGETVLVGLDAVPPTGSPVKAKRETSSREGTS